MKGKAQAILQYVTPDAITIWLLVIIMVTGLTVTVTTTRATTKRANALVRSLDILTCYIYNQDIQDQTQLELDRREAKFQDLVAQYLVAGPDERKEILERMDDPPTILDVLTEQEERLGQIRDCDQ